VYHLPAVGSTVGCLLKCITPHWYIPTRIWSTGNARSAKRIGPDNAAPENTGPAREGPDCTSIENEGPHENDVTT